MIIKKPTRTQKTCKSGHVYYTQPSGAIEIDICPICWQERENKENKQKEKP